MPLRGKVKNTEGLKLDSVLNNKEIKLMITSFGTGIGSDFDIEKLKYHKIIILRDADVDGEHIEVLLLTFFFRHLRPLVDAGHIYVANPPLYKIKTKTKEYYAYTDKEKDSIVKKLKTIISIQRYKGLGEMDSEQLWSTTLNPRTRTLNQIVINDSLEADQRFATIMGNNAEEKREFIIENSNLLSLK